MLKAPREKQLLTHKGTPVRLSADFSAETAGQKGVACYIQSDERKNTYNQEYSTRQSYHSDLKER